MNDWISWTGAIIALLLLLAVAHILAIRPWCMRLGATRDEAHGPWPGDELVPSPKTYATHVITIQASAEQIWPWIIQVGQGRAGFYSYQWLERLFGFQMENADQLVDAWQHLHVGDGIRLHQDATPLSVVTLEPARSLVLAGGRELQPKRTLADPSPMRLHSYRGYTWAFFLEAQADGSTRFIARIRATWERSVLNSLHNWLLMEPAHLIMQRGMNAGLKRRVEGMLANKR